MTTISAIRQTIFYIDPSEKNIQREPIFALETKVALVAVGVITGTLAGLAIADLLLPYSSIGAWVGGGGNSLIFRHLLPV